MSCALGTKTRLAAYVTLGLVALSVSAGARRQYGPTGVLGWIGLYSGELIEWLENENRLTMLCGPVEPERRQWHDCRAEKLTPKTLVVRLRATPTRSARHAGDLVVTAFPGKGLQASYIPAAGGIGRPVVPELFDGDWGYGPYFHTTIAEQRDAWVRLPADPFPPSTWLNAHDLGTPAPFYWLEEGKILTSPIGDVVVLGVSRGVIRVRDEQPRDMPCDGDAPGPITPFKERRLEGPTLFTPAGRLRVHVKYTRGC